MGIMGAIIQMNFKHATLRRGDAMESKLSNAEKNSEQAAQPRKGFGASLSRGRGSVVADVLVRQDGARPLLLGRFQTPGTDARQRVPTKAFPKAKGGPIYVSAKRTHRFLDGKVGLSNWGTIGSDGKNFGISVGSFSKTNPPGGVY